MSATIGEMCRLVRPRPKHLVLASLATLYGDFANIFLGGKHQREHISETPNGHAIRAFNHNFFHLVKLEHSERGKNLKIDFEHDLILEHVDGFGSYVVDQWRARAIPTAHDTMTDPDEIVQCSGSGTATHCFWKWYGGGPSPITVTLMKLQKGYFVPVTSFAVTANRLKKFQNEGDVFWRKGP